VKSLRKTILVIVLLAASATQMFACPACGSGNADMPSSPLTDGMNLGILTMLGVLVTVLASAATFFFFMMRKEALLAKNQNPLPQTPAKV